MMCLFIQHFVSWTERIQSEAQLSDWRLGAPSEKQPGETSRDRDAQRPRDCDSSSSSLFSLQMYLGGSSSASSSTESLSSSQQSNMGGQWHQQHTRLIGAHTAVVLLNNHTLLKKTNLVLSSQYNCYKINFFIAAFLLVR